MSEALQAVVERITAEVEVAGHQSTQEVVMDVLALLLEANEVWEECDETNAEDVVVELVNDIYWAVNPDLPWIPEPFETIIETGILKYLVPELVSKALEDYEL